MIETAVRLFQRQGYNATSWRVLVDAAGTPWGSAHHHFPEGKEQLGLAAVELGAAAVALRIEQMFAAHKSPSAALRAWCRKSAQQLEQSGFVEGCPIATVALETSATSAKLAAACKAAFDSWRTVIAEQLVHAGFKRKRAVELASLTIVTFEGALLIARVSRSQAPLLVAGDQLASLVESEAT